MDALLKGLNTGSPNPKAFRPGEALIKILIRRELKQNPFAIEHHTRCG
jgi:hypothetical protein